MAPSNKGKVAKIAKLPHPIKQARAVQATGWMQRTIEPRFVFLDGTKNWKLDGSVCQCDALELLSLMQNLERRQWRDVLSNPKRDHPIVPSKLEKPAQERLKELRMDDVDELWSFHVNQLGRLWGVRLEHEFRILWLDPDHRVYVVDIQERDRSRAG